MTLVLPGVPSFSERLGQGLGSTLGSTLRGELEGMQQRKRDSAREKAASDFLEMDVSGYDPETIRGLVVEKLKQQGKERLFERTQSFLEDRLGGQKQPSIGSSLRGDETRPESMEQPEISPTRSSLFDASQIRDEDIIEATALNPNLGRAFQAAKDTSIKQQKQKRQEFEGERGYHTGFSKEAEKEANQLRTAIPKKELALNFSRDAVETGDVSYFSPDKLADITGIDLFRTAKGAQLITASKENLLSNMARVSSKAQNIWFEQRLNSMFPKIGQSQEANLTTQEMLEGEVAMDKAYLNAFDSLAKEDEEKYGYVRKDIQKRAQEEADPVQKEIFSRTSYRMKELEEKEKGLSAMQKQVGKKVPKGTPLTLAMAKLYKDKFGNDALKVAEKSGYYVPTLEEFQKFQASPREFREEL